MKNETKLKLKTISNFEFDPKEHVYKLDGKLLTGVTTILKVRSQPWMEFWRSKAMYNALLPKLSEVQGIDIKRWEDVLAEAKNAGNVRSKEALESGKIAHDWIEKYIKIKIASEDNRFFLEANTEDEKANSAITQFLKWEEEHHVVWLLSEEKMCSPTHMIGGTVDAVAVIDGVLTVLDFKTSNQVSEDVALQTAAYQILIEENLEEGSVPQQRAVLRIPKDASAFEYQIIQTDPKFDRETFLNLRQVHRWNTYIENNFTAGTNKYDKKTKLDNK